MALVNRLIGLASPGSGLRRAIALAEDGRAAEAFPLFTRAAKAGIPEAEFRVAKAYLEGNGVPASRAEGARWLQRAAEHGFLDAQTMLAALCINGLVKIAGGTAAAEDLFSADAPTEPDFDMALKWSRLAAAAGSMKGQALLAYVLTNGPEPMRDLVEARKLYELSAGAGCPEGCLGYALALARTASSEDDRREVVRQLRRAAEAEIPTAIYLLAVLTEQGTGVARDPKVAVRLYGHAAERGHRAAQLRWGLALMAGTDVEQDTVAGEFWLRRAALAGDAEAAALVGDLYARSGPLPPNYTEAAAWYRRAATAGHKGAARALGSLYLTGAGVVQDNDEAARWLRIPAEQGDRASQVDLANLVLRGAGDSADSERVAAWFKEAAASGDLVSAFNLGVCLARGVGVERDEEQAADWLRRAAEGIPEAQYMYGRMLCDGRGVERNLDAARLWFARAAEAGMPDAQVALGEMLLNGRGGAADPEAALALFEKSAETGHSGALFALGALRGGGHGLPADRVAAQQCYRAAAERGHAQAQLMLGRYLARGAAGERNTTEARIWLERAIAQGVDEARAELAELVVPAAS